MAMIDYGAIVIKNGKIINSGDDLFMDMESSVGWVDYPFKRYSDCDCLDDDKYSACEGCPRAHFEMKEFDGEQYKSYTTDCKDNPINRTMAGIDVINGNYYAYIGNKHITLCFYKFKILVCIDGKIKDEIWMNFDERVNCHKSVHLNIEGYDIHIKTVLDCDVYDAHIVIDGDHYHVLFGYGIDPDSRVWNSIKDIFLGKRGARTVDNYVRKYLRK